MLDLNVTLDDCSEARLAEIEDNAEHHAVFRRRLCLSNSIARKLSGNAVWVSVRAFLADQRFPGRYSSGSSVWSTTHSDPHYRPAHCVTPWDDLVLQFEFCSETAWNVAEQKETLRGRVYGGECHDPRLSTPTKHLRPKVWNSLSLSLSLLDNCVHQSSLRDIRHERISP